MDDQLVIELLSDAIAVMSQERALLEESNKELLEESLIHREQIATLEAKVRKLQRSTTIEKGYLDGSDNEGEAG